MGHPPKKDQEGQPAKHGSGRLKTTRGREQSHRLARTGLQGRERPVALAEWTRVVEVVGELMEPTEDYPRRYRVREFPDRAALDAIGVGEMEPSNRASVPRPGARRRRNDS